MIARALLTAALLSTAALAYAAAPGASAESGEGEAPVAAVAQEEAGAAPAEEEKICRTERVTGSLTRRNRICLTQAQWRAINDRTRKGIDEMTSVASGGKECVLDPAGGCR